MSHLHPLSQTTNVVGEVVSFLHTFTADRSKSNLKQISQILQSLIEMCVGNIENQEIVFDRLIMDPLNRILQLSLTHDNSDDEKVKIINFYVNETNFFCSMTMVLLCWI